VRLLKVLSQTQTLQLNRLNKDKEDSGINVLNLQNLHLNLKIPIVEIREIAEIETEIAIEIEIGNLKS
jgi:hypothetical protein